MLLLLTLFTRADVCLFECFCLCVFRRFLGGVVRLQFLQRLAVALHRTLSSYLRDALGSADTAACLPVSQA
jgi:hypothetical protein